MRAIVCIGTGMLAGNLAFSMTQSLLVCGFTSFVVTFIVTTLWVTRKV